MGVTSGEEYPFAKLDAGIADGCCRDNICGSYLHGIFDSREVSEALVGALYSRKGLSFAGSGTDRESYKQAQYDILAETVRRNADIDMIYRIIEKGI